MSMDDLSARLSEILNDPAGMEQVRRMAEGLLKNDGAPPPAEKATGDFPLDLDAASITRLAPLISRLRSGGDDPRVQFLNALKPNLSSERQAKVDTAIKLLKLIELLPYLKESGLLNL